VRRILAISGFCILAIASVLSGMSAAQGGASGPIPASLNQMTDEVDLIAEVVVESVFPPSAQRQQALPGGQIVMHRDALLRVTRVLKGSQPSSHIVHAGEVGSGLRENYQSPYPVLNVGRSLIIFFRKTPKELVERLAERTQPRYDGRHGRAGIVEIDQDGKVHLMATLPFRAQYDGRDKSLMIAEVESRVRATGATR
jgi:hypothetical protein